MADSVIKNAQDSGFRFPVALDSQSQTWSAWGNHIWPAVYLVDRRGYVRYWWYGELKWQGGDNETAVRTRIQELLAEPT